MDSMNEYYVKNKDRIISNNKKYYKNNLEYKKEYFRNYYNENKEYILKFRAFKKLYKLTNKEDIKNKMNESNKPIIKKCPNNKLDGIVSFNFC
jgi:hypothetical protein